MIITLVATSPPTLPKEKSIRNERTNDLARGESPHLRKELATFCGTNCQCAIRLAYKEFLEMPAGLQAASQ